MLKIDPDFAIRFHNIIFPASSRTARAAILGAAALAVCALPAPGASRSRAKTIDAAHSVTARPQNTVHPVAARSMKAVHPVTARSMKADTPQMAAQPNAQAFTSAADSPFRPILHYQNLWNGVEHAFYIRVEDADHRMIVFKIADSHEYAMVQLILTSPGGAQTDGKSISSNLMATPSK